MRRRSYFPTERGLRSLEYLIALARAHLLLRSRAVEIEFELPLRARDRTVLPQERARLRPAAAGRPGGRQDHRLSFSVDGDSGAMIGSVTIGCAVGYGGAIEQVDGEPVYVDDDYVENDYQAHDGNVVVLGPGDVGYSVPIDAVNDDGLDLLGGLRRAT